MQQTTSLNITYQSLQKLLWSVVHWLLQPFFFDAKAERKNLLTLCKARFNIPVHLLVTTNFAFCLCISTVQDIPLSYLETRPVELVYFAFLEAYFDDIDEEENYSACCRDLRAIQGSAEVKVELYMC